MALSRLDFPDPLVPSTTVNVPRSSARSTPSSARTSLGVSRVKDVGDVLEPKGGLRHVGALPPGAARP